MMRTCAFTWAERRVQALSDSIFGSVQTDFLHREFAKNRYVTPGGMFLAGRSKRERKVETDSYMRGYWKQPADTIRIKCESRAFTIVLQTGCLPEPVC